jgi:hypothetical protein
VGNAIVIPIGVYTALVLLDVERVPAVLDGLPLRWNGRVSR